MMMWCAVPNGYPIPDPNPKFFSIPAPYPICFQNHRVWIGYRVFHVFDMENAIKELQDIDSYHLIPSSMYFGPISMGISHITKHNYVIPVFPWVLHKCYYGILYLAPNLNKIIDDGGIAPEFMGLFPSCFRHSGRSTHAIVIG